MWNDAQLQYGKLLLEKRHPVLKRYLEREIRIRTDILKSSWKERISEGYKAQKAGN